MNVQAAVANKTMMLLRVYVQDFSYQNGDVYKGMLVNSSMKPLCTDENLLID